MPKYPYRLTLTLLDPTTGGPAGEAVHADFDSHDDIAAIVTRLRERPDLDGNEAAALGLGLKSLGWVLLRHKKTPPFAEFLGQLGAFIKTLKTG